MSQGGGGGPPAAVPACCWCCCRLAGLTWRRLLPGARWSLDDSPLCRASPLAATTPALSLGVSPSLLSLRSPSTPTLRFNAANEEIERLRAAVAAKEAEVREAKQAEQEFAAECERLEGEFSAEKQKLMVGAAAADGGGGGGMLAGEVGRVVLAAACGG